MIEPVFTPVPSVQGIILDWHDGDTCHVRVALYANFGYTLMAEKRLRLARLNAPELNTEEGKAALAYARQLAPPGPYTFTGLTLDKYDRFLASIRLADGQDFAGCMISAGHGVVPQ